MQSEVRQSRTPTTTAHRDVIPVAETQDANRVAEMTGMFSEYIPLDGDELDWSMFSLPSLDPEDLQAQLQDIELPLVLPGSRSTALEGLGSSTNADQVQDDLLDYYRRTLTPLMMPTISPAENPWLCIYLQLAMQETSSPTRIALRHALMSVAAQQRAFHCRGNARDVNSALYHEQEAFRLVSQNMENAEFVSSSGAANTLLAAALSLISIEVFNPKATDCNIYLELARRVVDMHDHDGYWSSSVLTSALYQIFRCYDMVAKTAQRRSKHVGEVSGISLRDTNDRVVSENGVLKLTPNVQLGPNRFILDAAFGISMETMSVLCRITDLGSLFAQSTHPIAAMRKAALDLARQLYSIDEDTMSGEAQTSASQKLAQFPLRTGRYGPPEDIHLPQAVNDELSVNHRWAFHYAVILYFHRVIPDSYSYSVTDDLGQSKLPPNLQHVVRQVWDRLEVLDCLTRDISTERGNTLWPAFIAAVESYDIELRHRAISWFAKACKKGVGNVKRAKEVVLEVWRRVDRQISENDLSSSHGLGPVDWRLVMEEMGLSIMLT